MTHKYTTYFKWVNIIIDYIILNFSILLALHLDDAVSFTKPLTEPYKLNFLLLNLFWFYCAKLIGLYNNVLKRDAAPTMKDAALTLFFYLVAVCILAISFPYLNYSFKFLILSQVLFTAALLIWKFYFLALRRSQRRFWVECTRIVILGASRAGMEVSKYLNVNPQLGYKVEGIFNDNPELTLEPEIKLLGKVDDCFDYMNENGISELYCALPNKDAGRIKLLMQEADKRMIRFKVLPDINEFLDQKVVAYANEKLPLLTMRAEPLENKANEVCKRIFDIVFSLFIVTFILSWLIPVLGLIIKYDSKGPVFFKQLRSGKDNKPFYCFKFRTMAVYADSEMKQTQKGDSRITKVGAFLRKTSMDELPQFINVLLGDMSVVGPRPHMLKHTLDYAVIIDKYMVRQFLTPGITGWAQVNGFRGETKEPELMFKRVEADLWYLENWSFFLDVRIVLLTIWQTIKGSDNVY